MLQILMAACPNTSDNISKSCDNTLGIKSKAYAIREDEVSAIAAAVAGVIPSITRLTGKKAIFIELAAELSKNSFKSASVGDLDAKATETTVELVHPGVDPANNVLLEQLQKGSWLLFIEDKDGVKWIVGVKNDGVNFTLDQEISGSLKQTKITGKLTHKGLIRGFSGDLEAMLTPQA